jgi:deoxyadenosine/deoxycytidine kinase
MIEFLKSILIPRDENHSDTMQSPTLQEKPQSSDSTCLLNTNTKEVHFVSISGAIGSGKSSIITELFKQYQSKSRLYDLVLVEEPIQEWDSYLALYYTNQKRYAFLLQMLVLKHQYQIWNKYRYGISSSNKSIQIILTERCPIDAYWVFSQIQDMESKELQLIKDFSDLLLYTPDTLFYICASADTCHDRIVKRNMVDACLKKDYCNQVCEQYEKVMKSNNDFKTQIIRIDNDNNNLHAISNAAAHILLQLEKQFIKQ